MQLEFPPIMGLVVITPRRFGDARGFFCETWNPATLADNGVNLPAFVQDNHSFSAARGTVRGLHFQAPPFAQGKLVRCGRGALFDVAVDIRRGSPTYGQWFGVELSFENGKQLWIPAGFAHGFMTLTPDTEIIYKCTAPYAPEHEGLCIGNLAGLNGPLPFAEVVLPEGPRSPALSELDSPFDGGTK